MFLPPLVAARPSPAAVPRDGEAIPGQVLVGYDSADMDPRQLTVANVAGALPTLRHRPGVAFAEPVYRVHTLATPPNPGFSDQWSLQNSGQRSGTPGADVDAPRAWDVAGTGSPTVLVGTVDSGVTATLPQLAGLRQWTNPGESGTTAGGADRASNGVDDDHDGCVDDLHGCDFVDGDGDPADLNGHGTATASVIAAPWSAMTSYAGIAPGTTLITARAVDANGNGTTATVASAIDYLADEGARVVNISLGAPDSQAIGQAIARHPQTLFVAAAGNSALDVDAASANAVYPCADPAPNVLCVGATTTSDALASFSNWGARSVDLAAPGDQIDAPLLNGATGGWFGTSFAAPLVTGTAALMLSERPGATVAQLVAALLGSVEPRPTLAGRTVSGGRLDAYAALMLLAGRTPAARPAPVVAAAPTVVPAAPAPSAPATAPTAATPSTARRTPAAARHAATVAASTRAPAATAPAPLRVDPRARRRGLRHLRVTLVARGSRAVTGRISTASASGTASAAARVASGRPVAFRLRAHGRATVLVPATLRASTRSARLVVRADGVTLRALVHITAQH